MTSYVALLRGVNVGGKALLKMADVRDALTQAGLKNVRTYIQSGNVLFESSLADKKQLTELLRKTIGRQFALDAAVALFAKEEWQDIIAKAPKWWGESADFKHNLIVMLDPYDMAETVAAYGQPKPEIEFMEAGAGVLYQSLSWKHFGKTVGGKLAANPIYKQLTIRNYNTATKLLTLLDT